MGEIPCCTQFAQHPLHQSSACPGTGSPCSFRLPDLPEARLRRLRRLRAGRAHLDDGLAQALQGRLHLWWAPVGEVNMGRSMRFFGCLGLPNGDGLDRARIYSGKKKVLRTRCLARLLSRTGVWTYIHPFFNYPNVCKYASPISRVWVLVMLTFGFLIQTGVASTLSPKSYSILTGDCSVPFQKRKRPSEQVPGHSGASCFPCPYSDWHSFGGSCAKRSPKPAAWPCGHSRHPWVLPSCPPPKD